MPVCRFFQKGNCKFGDKCKNEHPGAASQANYNQNQPRQPQNSANRYNALGGHTVTPANNTGFGGNQRNQSGSTNNTSYRGNQGNQGYQGNQNNTRNQSGRGLQQQNNTRSTGSNRYALNRDIFNEDLNQERPQWIMSAYGPGRDAPIQLFGGFPLEQSMEEIRVQHYLALAAGNPQQSAQLEQELAAQANQQAQSVLADIDGAINYIIDGSNTHPNRIDQCIIPPNPGRGYGPFSRDRPNKPRYQPPAATSGFQSNQQNGFPQPQQSALGGLGGQQVGFASQPSAFGQDANNAFGGMSASQQQSGFGQNIQAQAPFGQPAPGQTPFGQQQQQPTQPFGQQQDPNMSAFGVTNQAQSAPFGQPQAAGVFGMPEQQQANGAFGQGFGPQLANPEAFGQLPQTQGLPFGQQMLQPQQIQNGTGQHLPPTNSAFGLDQAPQTQQVANGFGNQQIQPQNSNFGAPSPNPASVNGFGTNMAAPQQQQQAPTLISDGFHPQTQNEVPPQAGQYQPADLSTYSTRDNNGRILTWHGKVVKYVEGVPCYQGAGNQRERIWFPDGTPAPQSWEAPSQEYTQEMIQAYQYLMQHGHFQGGIMPEMAPRVEMARFDV